LILPLMAKNKCIALMKKDFLFLLSPIILLIALFT